MSEVRMEHINKVEVQNTAKKIIQECLFMHYEKHKAFPLQANDHSTNMENIQNFLSL